MKKIIEILILLHEIVKDGQVTWDELKELLELIKKKD